MTTFSFPISRLLALSIAWVATTTVSNAVQPPEQTRFNQTIMTNSGPVFGNDILHKGRWVKQYLGIPYAKPPVGELRFKKPLPVEPWNEILMADKMPPACIQFLENTEYHYPWYDAQSNKSEDCLFLNIWVPTDSAGNIGITRLPTIFWIFGGEFIMGSISQNIYDGHVLAARGSVIVVTINYRMGAFGFFTTGENNAPGNVGMYDMLEALKWVYTNIAVFGGNPSEITLAGQGSGAIAVGLLCVSPLTKGLYRGVIMESGSPAYLFAEDNTASLKLSQRLAQRLQCASGGRNISIYHDQTVACMRGKDPIEIAKALNSFHPGTPRYFLPSYGHDELLPVNARQALINGEFNHAPVLIGVNQDEGAIQIMETYPEATKSIGASELRDMFNTDHIKEAIIKQLVGVKEEEVQEIHDKILAASTDYSILCPTVYFAESYAKAGNNVYFYYFVHHPTHSRFPNYTGVVHYDEVQYVFGLPMQRPLQYQHEDVLMSEKVISLWSEFTTFGSVEWGTYSRQKPQYAELHPNPWPTYDYGPHKESCDFFRASFGFDQMLTNF